MLRTKLKWPIFITILLITYALWLHAKFSVEQGLYPEEIFLYLSQLFAVTAVILMSLNFILSARSYFVESLFGGLDKMYRFHRRLGQIAFVLAWFHPVLLLVTRFVGIESLRLYFIPGSILWYNFGISALYTLTLIIMFTVIRVLLYHIWKHTHRLMILVLILVGMHMFSALTPEPLFRLWMFGWLVAGIFSWIYVQFLYKKVGPVFYYKVVRTNKVGEITELYLEPQNKPLLYKPGQFVFMSFMNNKDIGGEFHPFSISSNPHEYSIRISAKSLGDYTNQLTKTNIGDLVKLIGPYGYFTSERTKGASKQIWIAGGIGVTPFLSMLASEKDEPSNGKIHFFYSTKTEEEAVYKDEILKGSEELSDLHINFNYDNKDGYLNAKKIAEQVGDLTNAKILICGPKIMMYTLRKQFKELGLTDAQIIFEDFALKPE